MKAVIQTQFLENYGAHAWDGQGECPQRWKPKGGDTWVVECSIEQNQDPKWWDAVLACIEHKSDYAQEYSVGEDLVDDVDFDVSKYTADWDTPIFAILAPNGKLVASRKTLAWQTLDPVARQDWIQGPGAEMTDHAYTDLTEAA